MMKKALALLLAAVMALSLAACGAATENPTTAAATTPGTCWIRWAWSQTF